MDRSIVKQLEKEKNSNFNVEHFVVMLIYWGTIIANVPSRYKSYPNGYAIPVMLTCMLMKVFLLGNQLLYKRYVYF